MSEKWMPIPFAGFSNYEVSNLGRVRSKARLRSDGKRWMPERYLGHIDTCHGYLCVTLYQDGLPRLLGMRRFRVHNLVLRAFIGAPPAGMEARHLDGDRSNAALANLAWGTHEENEADKATHQTKATGEANPASRLTAAQVAEIRALATSLSQRRIAAKFGVSQPTVGRILRRKNWAAA